MFNVDQTVMTAKTDNPSDPTRLKRHLSVIEEHLDEDPTADDPTRLPRINRRATDRATTDSQEAQNGKTGSNSSPLRSPTPVQADSSAKKTRRKAVYGVHSPVLLCFPPAHNGRGSSSSSRGDGSPQHSHTTIMEEQTSDPVPENENLQSDSGSRENVQNPSERDTDIEENLTHLKDAVAERDLIRLKEAGQGEGEFTHLNTTVAEGELTRLKSVTVADGDFTHLKDKATERDSLKDAVAEAGDLTRLKDTATKLNLKTRRQSYLTWRATYVDRPARDSALEVKVDCWSDDRLTAERKERIDRDLQWIKGQLVDLRRQDQSLARQLLGIRHELSNLRLAVSCEEHRDLLDDAEDHVQELRELSRFVDFPPDLPPSPSSLKHVGVTKMNLSSRRFSTC